MHDSDEDFKYGVFWDLVDGTVVSSCPHPCLSTRVCQLKVFEITIIV